MTHVLSEQIQRTSKVLGLDMEKVEALLARAGKEVDAGLLPAAQLAIARDGEVVFQYDYGDARSDSPTCIFSATKAITSSAAWLLFQQGDLREDELVVDIPEFDTNDKHTVTVGQLFAHTAGFPNAPLRRWTGMIKISATVVFASGV